MVSNFVLVRINSDYCDFLRKFDFRVSYNKNNKELRPFVGVLFNIGDFEYFAPLTSPKKKHLKMRNTLDFMKLDGGKLGAINFNNMIPLIGNVYNVIDFTVKPKNALDKKYYYLLRNQLDWLNSNPIKVKKHAKKLYELYTNNKLSTIIKNRCCDFKLLEEKCIEYNQVTV